MSLSEIVDEHGWWLLSRTAGIVALLAITASVGLGLLMAIREKRRPGFAAAVRGTHEHLALVGLVSIAVHGLALLGDPWLRPGVEGIAVPFALAYETVWVALGIVGGYLAAVLGLSFYVRDRIGRARWRIVHRASSLVYVLAVLHTIGAGTDASTVWMQALLIVTGAPIVALLLIRVSQPRRRAPAPTRAGARPAGEPA